MCNAFRMPSLKSALKKTNNDTWPCNIQGIAGIDFLNMSWQILGMH